jgi:hypothetical protein
MTPEERSLLERTHKLAEENNEILRSIRRSNRISIAMRLLYWVVIIGISLGAFYLIQPYIEAVTGAYQSISGVTPTDGTTESLTSVSSLLKLLGR